MDTASNDDEIVYKLAEVGEIGSIYNFYITIAAVCTLLLFVQILDYFKFYGHMNTLLMVISRGKSTMIFFVAIYLILIFGFSISGFMIFGLKGDSYRTIGYSFINTFKIASGGFDYEDIRASDYIMAPIFFVLFKLFFSLILLSMLTSIVAAGYEETVRIIEMDSKGERQKGTKELIENELQREFDSIEEQNRYIRSQMDPKEYKSLIMSKMPIKYKLFAKIISMQYYLPKTNEELATTRTIAVRKLPKLNYNNREASKESESLASIDVQKDNEVTVSSFIKHFLSPGGANLGTLKAQPQEHDLTKLEKNQVAIWRNALEESLMQKSDSELKLFDFLHESSEKETRIEFYPKKSIEELNSEMKDFIFASRMSFKQKGMWKKADLQKKYEFWCTMDTLHSEYYKLEVNADKEAGVGVTANMEETKLPDDRTQIGKKLTSKVDGIDKDSLKEESKEEVAKKEVENDNEVGLNSYEEEDKKEEQEIEKNQEEQRKEEEIKKEEDKKENSNDEENKNEEAKSEEAKSEEIKKEETKSEVSEELKKETEGKELSDEESKDASQIIVGLPLVPRDINLTIKGMLDSPEYASNYAQTISELQKKYWDEFTIEEKLELWLFEFTGKQRVKLWKQFQFSESALNKFIEKSPTDAKNLLCEYNNVHDVWLIINDGLPVKGETNELEETLNPSEVLRYKVKLVKGNV
jgi:hypothetical protein